MTIESAAEANFKAIQYRETARLFEFFLGWRYKIFLFLVGLIDLSIVAAYLTSSASDRRGYVFGVALLALAVAIAICGIVFEARFRSFLEFSGSYLRGQDDLLLGSVKKDTIGTYFQQYAVATVPGRLSTSQSIVIRAIYVLHALACLGIGINL